MSKTEPDNLSPQPQPRPKSVDVGQASIDRASLDESGKPISIVGLINRHMHYPNAYTWLLLMSSLDVMLTWVILFKEGQEVNPIANYVIDKWGLEGMIVYKFTLILFFITVCEIVGTLRRSTGLLLSRVSVAIAAFPVVWSLFLLARFNGLVG